MELKPENFKPFTNEAMDKVAEIFSLLSDTKRLLILQQLKHGEQTVSALVESTQLKQAAASKHLGLMYNGKLLTRRKEGNKVFYNVSDKMIYELCGIVCLKLQKEQSEFAEINFEI